MMCVRPPVARGAIGFLLACVLTVAAPAGAGVTVDLTWLDTGTSTLSVAEGDGGNNACDGFNFSGAGRCMKVTWTIGVEGLDGGGNSVSWDVVSGITALRAAFFPNRNAIPVGKAAAFLRIGATPIVDNPAGEVRAIAGALDFAGINEGDSTFLPGGTYTVGTIIWDVSSAPVGVELFSAFEVPGLDGFLDGSNEFYTDVVLNGATLVVTPEPGTAALLALALGGLAWARRRSG